MKHLNVKEYFKIYCEIVSFANQIKYKYYGCNQYVSTQGISVEKFSATTQPETTPAQ